MYQVSSDSQGLKSQVLVLKHFLVDAGNIFHVGFPFLIFPANESPRRHSRIAGKPSERPNVFVSQNEKSEMENDKWKMFPAPWRRNG